MSNRIFFEKRVTFTDNYVLLFKLGWDANLVILVLEAHFETVLSAKIFYTPRCVTHPEFVAHLHHLLCILSICSPPQALDFADVKL